MNFRMQQLKMSATPTSVLRRVSDKQIINRKQEKSTLRKQNEYELAQRNDSGITCRNGNREL